MHQLRWRIKKGIFTARLGDSSSEEYRRYLLRCFRKYKFGGLESIISNNDISIVTRMNTNRVRRARRSQIIVSLATFKIRQMEDQ